MRNQSGIGISQLLLWAAGLGLCLLVAMKLIPTYVEYFGVKRTLTVLVKEKAGASAAEIRDSFSRHAEIEGIKSVNPNDLDIVQDQSGTQISVNYQREVPLVANVKLVFEFSVEQKHGAARE